VLTIQFGVLGGRPIPANTALDKELALPHTGFWGNKDIMLSQDGLFASARTNRSNSYETRGGKQKAVGDLFTIIGYPLAKSPPFSYTVSQAKYVRSGPSGNFYMDCHGFVVLDDRLTFGFGQARDKQSTNTWIGVSLFRTRARGRHPNAEIVFKNPELSGMGPSLWKGLFLSNSDIELVLAWSKTGMPKFPNTPSLRIRKYTFRAKGTKLQLLKTNVIRVPIEKFASKTTSFRLLDVDFDHGRALVASTKLTAEWTKTGGFRPLAKAANGTAPAWAFYSQGSLYGYTSGTTIARFNPSNKYWSPVGDYNLLAISPDEDEWLVRKTDGTFGINRPGK